MSKIKKGQNHHAVELHKKKIHQQKLIKQGKVRKGGQNGK